MDTVNSTVRNETDAYWNAIPLQEPEAEAARLGGRDLTAAEGYATFTLPRRTLLKTMGVLGTALALNITGAIPKRLLPTAAATRGSEYGNCTIFADEPGYTGACWGAPYARSYCGNDGWFLNYSSASFNSWPVAECNSRNAWRWGSSPQYRCADGRQAVSGQSAVFRICSWAL